MWRRYALALSWIIVLGLLPGSALSQQKSLKDQLVGTWTLVAWEQTNKDGTKSQRFGANPKGVNVFDANGHMFVMFARADLPKIASNDPMNPTPEEAKAIAAGSIAYFGTYTVDEAAKTIVLRIESSTLANQLGVDQKRIVNSVTADELKMTNPASVAGNVISYTFKRAK
jgi:hypothetical protein